MTRVLSTTRQYARTTTRHRRGTGSERHHATTLSLAIETGDIGAGEHTRYDGEVDSPGVPARQG